MAGRSTFATLGSMRLKLAALLGLAALAGCSHVQPSATAGCHLTAYPLRVQDAHFEPGIAGSPRDFEALLAEAMQPPSRMVEGTAQRPSVLVLSGGSQHGAFGAGLFAGMDKVPDYKMVTAVSTGALQSTFVFLANAPVPADRRYPAYMQALGAGRSNLGDLELAYTISSEADLLKVGAHGQLGAVVRGSAAQFDPLRQTLRALLSPETLRAVGAAYRPNANDGRRLLVGVTDTVDGNGYAIDLTELASRLLGERPAMGFEQVQGCYIDALVASSSVPLAVPPVTLEAVSANGDGVPSRHMYIDGGARFGVFYADFAPLMRLPVRPEVTLIVNGRLYGKPWRDHDGNPQTNWSSLTLGLRAVDILENQVYRFSVETVQRIGTPDNPVRFAFISGQGLPADMDPDRFEWQGRTCEAYSREDEAKGVIEFHPRYMKCLIEYGRQRGAAQAWNVAEPGG